MLDSLLPGGLWPLVATVVVVTASAVFRGFTGFGFAVIAVPLLSLTMPPLLAVTLAAGLQFLGGVLDLRSVAPLAHWGSVRWMVAGAVVASPLGTLALTWLPEDVARLVLAAACGIAVVALAAGFGFRSLPGKSVTVATGMVSGLFNGLASMPGPPALAYYLASPLPSVQIRASLLVFFSISAALASASLVVIGKVGAHELLLVLAGLPLMLGGSRVGAALFKRGGGQHRRISLATLALVALITAVRGVTGLLH